MKRILSLVLALFFGVIAQNAVAQSVTPSQRVKDAVAALGGVDALRNLKTLTIKASAKHWEPEQSNVSGGPPRPLGVSTLAIAWDLGQGISRTDHEHRMDYPFPGNEKYSDIVAPSWGAVINDKGEDRAMAPNRLAFELREQERSSPVLLLKALDQPQNVSATSDQKLGKKSYPTIALMNGGTKFLILFDRATKLPVAIRTIEDDVIHGDGVYDLLLSDWKTINGAKVATALAWQFNGLAKLDIAYSDITANAAIPAQAFAVSDATKQAAQKPATGDVPWQAILVNINFGRYDDAAQARNAAAGLVMKLTELAPNVSHAQGTSHNSLIVAMKNYLVVFDAPQNEAQSRWTIDAAKAKYPGKPVKYLVMTHHHMDHMGGARTYVAEGATIIIGSPDKAHTVAELSAPRTMHPDALQKNPKPVKVIEVKDKMTLKDGEEIRIYRIPNPHAEGMLTMYVAGPKIVWVTDIYSPGRDAAKTPANSQFHDTIKQLGLSPALYAGGHGASASEADFAAMLAK
jgi:glyoxylase-like metal-dependent hydrolase (beta-lactamase superfamily II)